MAVAGKGEFVIQGGGFDERKAALRAEMRAVRGAISPAERQRADDAICGKACSLSQFEEAGIVFAYLSFGAEVETRGILEHAWRAGKEVALPRCVAPREMRWFLVSDFEGLERSTLGVEEPPLDTDREVLPCNRPASIALVPGLTFDDAGYRLGYGGGYYDAFLAGFAGVSVGLCREAQRSSDLRALGVIDSCDRAVDVVVFG